MIDTLGYIIMGIGVIFDLFGCVGLIRFPDVYNRLQASTKCVTLGTFSIMLGIFLISGFDATGIKALLCGVFVLISSPVAAHALAKGAYKSGVNLWSGSIVDHYGEDTKQEPQIDKE
ncbi:cation:proton antiporter [candidate division TA06 bacterium DG_26]|uniref:Cation:proton antiporter n=1 Tax=candidate division TA06 bacterium DG_26 TaxID=1703771 RepID=A0A0S7WM43_UNCT6|nr:MAG: cation:proton antiporter [candidate division TA06 bacterium DG_26]